MPSLSRCYNIEDLRVKAQRKLPAPMFHYIDGGADDEWTLRRNTAAFNDYQLMPNYLRDISAIDTSAQIMGCDLALPFFLAPTGMSRLFHRDKELGVCRAAAKFNTLYSLSTLATTSLEDVAAETQAAKMFQIYILKDRELTREFVERCKAAGYSAMCLTVDTMLAGNREREKKYGLTVPPTLSPSNLLSFATSFEWLLGLLQDSDFRLANVSHRVDAIGSGTMALIDYVNSQFDRSVNWDDVAWLVELWGGPFAIKGLQSAADAKRAVDVGASSVMISNHGGRQLDTSPAPFDCIRDMRDAVGSDLELIVDGGIRRGTHIIKALAMGADGCSIGRAYLYGLAAGGQAGVEHALSLLRDELERSMALLGCTSVDQLNESHLKAF
ncbi:MAG: alpha-hydroxy acid oxidase [Pseudomonadales bacterium]